MRDQRYFPGFIAILGSLVVLSVFVLVFGTTTPMAQPGQDERCSEYAGQAKGLCTAAVANGCFDGEESQECEDLAANWNERCRRCEGEPPWVVEVVSCPCNFSAANLEAIGAHTAGATCIFGGSTWKLGHQSGSGVAPGFSQVVFGSNLECLVFEASNEILEREPTSLEQRTACVNALQAAAAAFDITCS